MPGFNPRSSQRIERAVLDWERFGRRLIDLIGANERSPRNLLPIRYFMVIQDIKAGSANGPGLGYGKPTPVTYGAADAATYGPQGDTIPLYSGAATPIAAGRKVVCCVIDGRYHVIVDFC